jgi:hypothetical protein
VAIYLRPDDLVRIKRYQEILALHTAGSNRGLSFAAELVPYCDKYSSRWALISSMGDPSTAGL